MSIFISGLAFSNPEYAAVAKVGVFAASIISAVLGMALLSWGGKEAAVKSS